MFRKPDRKETRYTKPDHSPMGDASSIKRQSVEEALREAKARRMEYEPISYLNWR